MEVRVKKKSGKSEKFEIKKLENSMKKAMLDAGSDANAKVGEIRQVAKDVLEKASASGEITTVQIKQSVLAKLKAIDGAAAKAWEKFDRKYKE